jgi:hypothetical protein
MSERIFSVATNGFAAKAFLVAYRFWEPTAERDQPQYNHARPLRPHPRRKGTPG